MGAILPSALLLEAADLGLRLSIEPEELVGRRPIRPAHSLRDAAADLPARDGAGRAVKEPKAAGALLQGPIAGRFEVGSRGCEVLGAGLRGTHGPLRAVVELGGPRRASEALGLGGVVQVPLEAGLLALGLGVLTRRLLPRLLLAALALGLDALLVAPLDEGVNVGVNVVV